MAIDVTRDELRADILEITTAVVDKKIEDFAVLIRQDFDRFDKRFDGIDQRLDKVEDRLGKVESEVHKLNRVVDQHSIEIMNLKAA